MGNVSITCSRRAQTRTIGTQTDAAVFVPVQAAQPEQELEQVVQAAGAAATAAQAVPVAAGATQVVPERVAPVVQVAAAVVQVAQVVDAVEPLNSRIVPGDRWSVREAELWRISRARSGGNVPQCINQYRALVPFSSRTQNALRRRHTEGL